MNRIELDLKCEGCSARINSIFNDLNNEELNIFSLYKTCLNFKPQEQIFDVGGIPKGIYILNSGKIKISKFSNEGDEQIVRLENEGDIIGYRALLSGEEYSCSATAVSKSSLCFIPKAHFLDLFARNRKLTLKIMALLASDLKKAENKIVRLTHRTVRERMAEALLLLKETYGYEKDNCTIKINFTRNEIATLAGTTRESATRILYEFSDTGILGIKGSKITIINLKELFRTANISY